MNLPDQYHLHLTVFFRALLAGLIAVSAIFALDLPHASWAMLTIALLGFKVEVGSIYVKAIARTVGTIAGGVTGALITITFSVYPLLLIGSLSLVILLCASFTSRYQGMAGYGGFLAGNTCVLVVAENLGTTDIYAIGYFTLYRISEICLGIVALLMSSFLIWPSSSRVQLNRAIVELRSMLAQFADLAEHPRDDNAHTFVVVHTQLHRVMLDADQQRYYTTFIDHPIERISGYVQTVMLEILNQVAAFVTLRRILLRNQDSPQKCIVVREAFAKNYHQLDKQLEDIIELLSNPERLRSYPPQPGQESLLDLRNHRVSFYRSLTAMLALCLGFALWVITESPTGSMVLIGSVVVTMSRILARAPHIPLVHIVSPFMMVFVTVFVAEYVLVIQTTSFWLFCLICMPIQALAVWNFYRDPTNLTSMFYMFLFPLMMPINNTPDYQPTELFNNLLALFMGFLAGYVCIELVGNPDQTSLARDYIDSLARLIHQTITQKSSITAAAFRQQVMPLNFEMLSLYPENQETVLNWMDTATTIGSANLKLRGLEQNPQAQEESKALYQQVQEQINYLANHLRLPKPGETASSDDRVRQVAMDDIFDWSWKLYSDRKTSLDLDLMLLCGAVRRHHLLSHPDT